MFAENKTFLHIYLLPCQEILSKTCCVCKTWWVCHVVSALYLLITYIYMMMCYNQYTIYILARLKLICYREINIIVIFRPLSPFQRTFLVLKLHWWRHPQNMIKCVGCNYNLCSTLYYCIIDCKQNRKTNLNKANMHKFYMWLFILSLKNNYRNI